VLNLKANLRNRLRGAQRIAVLAVGSALRGDDAAGLLAAAELQKRLIRRGPGPEIAVFVGGTCPENLSGEIKKFQPTHLVILDAADIGRGAGQAELIDPDHVGLNASVSTHSLPVKVLTDYLRHFVSCQVVIVGIQPSTREFGREPSEPVVRAAADVAAAIVEAAGSD